MNKYQPHISSIRSPASSVSVDRLNLGNYVFKAAAEEDADDDARNKPTNCPRDGPRDEGVLDILVLEHGLEGFDVLAVSGHLFKYMESHGNSRLK